MGSSFAIATIFLVIVTLIHLLERVSVTSKWPSMAVPLHDVQDKEISYLQSCFSP